MIGTFIFRLFRYSADELGRKQSIASGEAERPERLFYACSAIPLMR